MRARRGFTLLEALIGIALAGLLAAAGATTIPALLASAQLSSATFRLATNLRLARGRALATGSPVTVRFTSTPSSYDAPATATPVVLPPGVRFVALPARRRVLFSALGEGENATLVLGTGRTTRQVVVNQRGRVRVP